MFESLSLLQSFICAESMTTTKAFTPPSIEFPSADIGKVFIYFRVSVCVYMYAYVFFVFQILVKPMRSIVNKDVDSATWESFITGYDSVLNGGNGGNGDKDFKDKLQYAVKIFTSNLRLCLM